MRAGAATAPDDGLPQPDTNVRRVESVERIPASPSGTMLRQMPVECERAAQVRLV